MNVTTSYMAGNPPRFNLQIEFASREEMVQFFDGVFKPTAERMGFRAEMVLTEKPKNDSKAGPL